MKLNGWMKTSLSKKHIIQFDFQQYYPYLCGELKLKIMARPIKETPVVTGKDAKRFAEKMAHLKPESKEEKEAAKKVYEKFKAIAASTF